MPEITNDAAMMSALGRAMTRAVQKQAVAAGNLANLDTPGYKTKEVKFSEALDGQLTAMTITASNPKHFGAAGGTDPRNTEEASGLALRRDGNNVQLDRELLSMTRATGDFSAAETVLAAKFRLVRYAINEGR
jgi:flagellar basal-body rod protein FlgB